jgi:hypothetical protein
LNILSLHRMGHPSNWKESLRAIEFMIEDNCPDFNVFTHDATFPLDDKFKNIDYDLIVLGPTFLWYRNHTLIYEQISEQFSFLRDKQAVKVALPQDDYDGSELLENWLLEWEVDVTYSVLWSHWNELYPRYKKKGKLKKGYTSYIPEKWINKWRSPKDFNCREIDISYRTNEYSRLRCSLRNLKCEIGNNFLKKYKNLVLGKDFRLDFESRNSAIKTNNEWHEFLENSKACLATPSGSSLLDKRGLIKDKIRLYQAGKNSVSFEEVYLKFIQHEDKGTIYTAISPRNLEAALSETLQIATVGEYSGLMESDKDYIKLEEDCSNIEEVLKISSCKQTRDLMTQRYKEKILDCKELRVTNAVAEIILEIEQKQECSRRETVKGYESLINEFRENQAKNYKKIEVRNRRQMPQK